MSPVLLESVVTILSWFRAKCAGHGISVTNFLISLKCSTSLLVHFHSVFFRNSCLLRFLSLESLGGNFAIYCIARGLNLIFYLISLILNLEDLLSTLHSVSFSFICSVSQPVFLEKTLDFIGSLCIRFVGVPRVLWTSFLRCFSLSPLFVILYHLITRIVGKSMLRQFLLSISSECCVDRRILF